MAMDAKQAVADALAYVQNVYGDTIFDVIPEEIEHDDGVWKITVSYARQNPMFPVGKSSISAAFATSTARQYKLIIMNENSGEVIAMKIRKHA